MALQSTHILLLLVLAMASVAKCSAGGSNVTFYYGAQHMCKGGLVGECIDGEEEMGLESESMRRILGGRRRHISYNALRANRVPCRRRGASYYGCNRRSRVNPYRRGCSAITRCARYLH